MQLISFLLNLFQVHQMGIVLSLNVANIIVYIQNSKFQKYDGSI